MDNLPFPFPLPAEVIAQRRAQILAAAYAQDADFACVPVRAIDERTPPMLAAQIDRLFMEGTLMRAYGQLPVTLSSRLTQAAGKFVYLRGKPLREQRAEIRLSSDFLFRLTDGPFHLNGLTVATPQEAMMVVLEHELCHALENALYGETAHSARFLSLAKGLFGHTDTHHSLPTRRAEAQQAGLVVGGRAQFAYQGRMLVGTITYIGKMFTVMVPDRRGAFRDRAGKRYAKYRVPPQLVAPAPSRRASPKTMLFAQFFAE